MSRRVLTSILGYYCVALFLSSQPVAIAQSPKQNAGSDSLVYVATNGNGIYAYRFSPGSDQLESIGLVAEINHPTWLAVSPNDKFLYSVSDGGPNGSVSSYSIDAHTGALKFLNRVSAGGEGTTYVTVDRTGKVLLANNFGSGQLMAFQVNSDGTIGKRTAFIQHTGSGPVPPLQTHARPHEEVIAADNRHVIAPDLGEDKIYTYLLDPSRGTLNPGAPPFVSLPPGTGPRHFVFHPNGRFGYVVDELKASITVFAYTSATGELKPIQTISMLPDNYTGVTSASELWVDRTGRFLYTSSRGDSTIVVFSIDPRQGTLTFLQSAPTQGKWPRGFALDLTEQYLFSANEHSNNVTVLKVESSSGKLSATGQALNVPAPASVLFVPAGMP